MYLAIVAILGAILGSFINALSFRYNTGTSVMRGRSRCMRCGHALGVLDLVPILSYLWLRGRCRRCHTRISIQYPLVEAAAAALMVGVYMTQPTLALMVVGALAWLTLLFVVIYDLRHTIIPWSCSGLVALLGLGTVLLQGFTLPALLAGPLLAAPLLLISLLSGGRWMGWGDGMLMLGLGWMLGPTAGLTALMLAFWSGGAVGIMLLLLNRAYTMRSEVPFAPFLVFGALVAYFLHVDIFQTLPLLFS